MVLWGCSGEVGVPRLLYSNELAPLKGRLPRIDAGRQFQSGVTSSFCNPNGIEMIRKIQLVSDKVVQIVKKIRVSF